MQVSLDPRADVLPVRWSPPGLEARIIDPDNDQMLDRVFRLRAEVFARELGWVEYPSDGRERDRADAHALHFGLYAGEDDRAPLAAYARVLVPPVPLMLQREFVRLLDGQALDHDPGDSFEVSRFAVHPEWRGWRDHAHHSAFDYMGRAVVLWARRTRKSLCLSVCEDRHVAALCRCWLAFERFGRVVEYQPGVRACAVRVDLERAADRMYTERSRDFSWYTHTPAPSLPADEHRTHKEYRS